MLRALADRLGRYGGELARLVPELAERVPGPARRRCGPTPRPSATGSSTPWPPGWPPPRPTSRCCSCSTTSSGRRSRRCCSCATSSGPADGRVLVLGTYRDTELTHDHPLVEVVADLRRQGGVERLSLSGLDDVGVAAIVEQASGRPLDEDEPRPGPGGLRGDGGQPVLRPGGAPPPGRDRRRRTARGRLDHPASGRPARHSRRGAGGGGPPPRPPVRRRQPGPADRRRRRDPSSSSASSRRPGDLSEETLLAAVEEAAGARVVIEVSATRYRFAHALDAGDPLRVAHRRPPGDAPPQGGRSDRNDPPGRARRLRPRPGPPLGQGQRPGHRHRPGPSTTPGRAGDRALAQLAHDEAADYYASGLDLLDAGGADAGRSPPARAAHRSGRGATASRRPRLPPDPARRRPPGPPARRRRRPRPSRPGQHARATSGPVSSRSTPNGSRCWKRPSRRSARTTSRCGPGSWPPWASSWPGSPTPGAGWRCRKRRCGSPGRSTIPETLAHVLLARDYTITAPENAAERFAATTELLAIADGWAIRSLASRALSLRFKAAMELADVAEAERCLARNQAAGRRSGPADPDLGHAAPPGHPSRCSAATPTPRRRSTPRTSSGCSARRADIGVFQLAQQYWLLLERGALGDLEEAIPRSSPSRPTIRDERRLRTIFLAERPGGSERRRTVRRAGRHRLRPSDEQRRPGCTSTAVCAILCARFGRRDCVSSSSPGWSRGPTSSSSASFAGWVSGPVPYLGLLATTTGDWERGRGLLRRRPPPRRNASAPPSGWPAPALEWARMLLARAEPNDAGRAHDLLRQALDAARERGLSKLEATPSPFSSS